MPTVMPDSMISTGRPFPRDTRIDQRGAGAPRRTAPGNTAAATGHARAGSRANGVARAERAEPRWRDIQWVDFTSEPDSGMGASDELPPSPLSAAPPPPPPPKSAAPARQAPRLDSVLQRFATPAAAVSSRTEAIAGLAPRFTRLPVPKLAMHRSRPATPQSTPVATAEPPHAPQAPARAAAVVVHPRTPAAAAPPPVRAPSPAAAAEIAPLRRSGQIDIERPFPASISTPVAVESRPAETKPRTQWHTTLATGVTATGGAVRAAASAAAASSVRGIAGARQIMRRRLPPREAVLQAEPPVSASKISDAIERVSRYIAARENRLRMSGIAALGVIGVALAAYIAGAVLAHVAEPKPSPAPIAQPAEAVDKQLAIADKVMHPASPAPAPAPSRAASANEPPSDPVARAKFYIERAKAGDAAAQYDIGVLYARGEGLVQDYASAANWFHASAAQGNVDAEYDLGVLYAQGLGVPANQTEAINWYRSAADREHPGAQFNLALAYATGAGAKQDYAAAARWYQRAAAHALTPAMINLAILYETGNGLERSPVDAYAWYSAAGERGDATGKARATELFKQFNDRDKARAEGLAATIGAALDSFNKTTPPA